jgi:hypothetical protein
VTALPGEVGEGGQRSWPARGGVTGEVRVFEQGCVGEGARGGG